MENKKLEKKTPVELDDDILDNVSGGGDVNETIPSIPTCEPILFKK